MRGVRWSGDGRALILFDQKRRVIAVPVQFEGGFRQGAPHTLFALPPTPHWSACHPTCAAFSFSKASRCPIPEGAMMLTPGTHLRP